jgi:hypothetical protein
MLRDPPTASGLVQATHSRDHPWTLSNVIKVLPWTVVFAVCWAASPTLAESPTNTDPCASGSHNASASVPGSTPIVRLECGTAIAVGKHVQRACRLIGEILLDPQIQRNKKLEAELYLTIDALRKKVLAPVYRQHHDLRGQDLAAANTAPPGGPDGLDVDSRPFQGAFGVETDGTGNCTLSSPKSHADSDALREDFWEAFVRRRKRQGMLKGFAHFGRDQFCWSPIDLNYPRRWRLKLKESLTRASVRPRTARSDRAFS